MEEPSGCTKHCRKELLFLEYPNPSRFAHGPWKLGRVHPIYLAYRLIMCVYLISTLVWGANYHFRQGKWFIFMTNWCYLAINVYNLISTYVILQEYFWERKHMKNGNPCPQRYQTMPRHYKATWVLYNISVSQAISITTWYWIFVYDPDYINDGLTINGFFHIGNTVYSVTEIIVGAPPMRFVHIYQVLIFSFVYLVFSIVYCELGGTDANGQNFIYATMDWRDPLNALKATAICLVSLIIIHLLTVVLGGVRSHIVRKIRNTSEVSKFSPDLIANSSFNKSFVHNV